MSATLRVPMKKIKRNYRVTYFGTTPATIIEGSASSPQNACRQAFKLMIKANLIKCQPATDNNWASSFVDTNVEVLPDE